MIIRPGMYLENIMAIMQTTSLVLFPMAYPLPKINVQSIWPSRHAFPILLHIAPMRNIMTKDSHPWIRSLSRLIWPGILMEAYRGVLALSVTTRHRIVRVCQLCPSLKIMSCHLSTVLGPSFSIKILERSPSVCQITVHTCICKEFCGLVGIPSNVAKGDN